jgi:hypothetical protein
MATDSKGAAAAPASPGGNSAVTDPGHALMAMIAGRVGMSAPVAVKQPAATPAAKPDDEAGEGDENKKTTAAATGSEGGDGAGEGADEGKGEGEGETLDDGNGEGEGEGEGEEAAPTPEELKAKAAADALAAENAKLVATALKDLPEDTRKRVQAVIDSRIGKVIAKERAKTDEATARISELETALAEAEASKGTAPVAVPGVHPLMFAKSESELDTRLQQIDAAEEFFIRHEDGYEGNGTPEDPPISAADLKLRWRDLARERDRIIPAARQALRERTAHDATLRQTAPTFFDLKTEDGRALQATLKLMPELRRHPDATALAMQFVLGQRALAALKAKAAAPAAAVKPAPKKAPRLPGTGSPAKGADAAPSRSASAAPAAMQKLSSATDTRGVQSAVAEMLRGSGYAA